MQETNKATVVRANRERGRVPWSGVLLWVVLAVAAVAVRGVRWDESLEHAQILSGHVAYASGHPLFRYVHNAFSLQTYLSAAAYWAVPSPLVLCGLRNVLFVLATVLPAYLLGALISRRALWGHVAAVLTLQGILLEFDSSYPMAVWPGTFTNGHIGRGYALVVLFLLIAGHRRSAFFLLGLMPAVHIGHMPALLVVGVLIVVAMLLRDDLPGFAAALRWAFGGLGLCALFWLVKQRFYVPAPTEGAFFSAEPALAIWREYTAADSHRAFPPGNAHITMAAALLLGAGAARTASRGSGERLWLFTYACVVAGIVYGVMAVHWLLGARTPFCLIGWMPYRLLNHVPPVLLAMLVAVLSEGRATVPDVSRGGLPLDAPLGGGRSGVVLLGGAVLYGLIKPLLAPLVGAELYRRYCFTGDAVLFGLMGASATVLARTLRRGDRGFFLPWVVLVVLAWGGLLLYHQFGAACVALGAAAAAAMRPDSERVPSAISKPLIAGVCVVSFAALLWQQYHTRQHLPKTEFDREIASVLADRGEEEAMLLAGPHELLLQARTGHPVLVDSATASLMSYMPGMAPEIQKMYGDLYGIRFAAPRDDHQPSWDRVWALRDRDEWRALSLEYGFRYIVAPPGTELDLPRIVRDERGSLYVLPIHRTGNGSGAE